MSIKKSYYFTVENNKLPTISTISTFANYLELLSRPPLACAAKLKGVFIY